MDDEIERSPGGSDLLRHEARERELDLSSGDAVLIDAVAEHLERHFGNADSGDGVFHELVSDLVHVDIHLLRPRQERPWLTLVTSGMAERPMTVPEGLEEYRYAELLISLPPDWPLERGTSEGDEAAYWPIRLLKVLARLPHEYETFLYYGHTIPNGDPAEPYSHGTELCCAWIAPPVLVPDAFHELQLADGRVLRFYAVIPLYEDEMRLKLQLGSDALADAMEEHGVTELVDVSRGTVARRRRFFGR